MPLGVERGKGLGVGVGGGCGVQISFIPFHTHNSTQQAKGSV